MFDELERLGEDDNVFALLAHYARAGAADREAWQGRLMAMDGVRVEELVKLHGELIAYDWAEQNTGEVPACYRVTPAGLRAFRQGMARRPGKAAAPVDPPHTRQARQTRDSRSSGSSGVPHR